MADFSFYGVYGFISSSRYEHNDFGLQIIKIDEVRPAWNFSQHSVHIWNLPDSIGSLHQQSQQYAIYVE